jgi:hypothetical protein
VTTFAGSGASDFLDGTGTNAAFRNQLGVAVDASGTIYIADYNNQRIRKLSTSGGAPLILRLHFSVSTRVRIRAWSCNNWCACVLSAWVSERVG